MIQQTSFTLPRSGNSPLKFEGRLLTEMDSDHEALRWYTVAIYQTRGGKYVVHVRFHTSWRGESDHDWVHVADSASDVATALRSYDVLPPGRGFPPGYEERQNKLRAACQRDYDDLVTEVLEEDIFVEAIE